MPGYQPRHDTDPVWFNGQQVNTLTVASAQTGVRITAVYGWDERPDVRDVRELRSGQDGEYADNLYLGGRTITIEGEVYGSSWVNLQSRKRTLAALFNPSSTEALLKIPDPATASPTGVYATTGMTGYERVSARVVEAIQFGDTLDPACQVWQVVLRASDPRVYSDTATSTDSGTSGTASRTVTVDQTGTYETPPTLTVTGPTASDWRISEPSSGLNLDMSGLTLAASETVVFDVKDRTATFTGSYEKAKTNRTDLVALWMLDETSGTTADNEQGTAARDGTYSGTYTLNQAGPFSGIASVDLDGSTGKVAMTYQAAMATTTFTFEAWINWDGAPSLSEMIAQCAQSGAGGWYLSILINGGLLFRNRTSAGATANSATAGPGTIVAGSWYHVVVVVPGPLSGPQLFVNGVRVDTNAVAGTYAAATTQGIELANPGVIASTNFFDGKMSSVAYYNTAASAATVLEWYEGAGDTAEVGSAYQYLLAPVAEWASLGTGSSVYTLASGGLGSGSKLNVSYRDARL